MSFSPSKHSRLLCAWSSPSLPSTVPMTSRPPRSAESTADWATATAVSATEASATVDTTVVPWATEPDTTAVWAVWADTTVDTTADTQVVVPNRTHLSSQFVLTHRSSLCRIPRRRWILRWCPRPRIPRIRRTRIPRTALNGEQCERVISSEGTSRQRHCGQVPNCKKGCSCFFTHQRPKPPPICTNQKRRDEDFPTWSEHLAKQKAQTHKRFVQEKRIYIIFTVRNYYHYLHIVLCLLLCILIRNGTLSLFYL